MPTEQERFIADVVGWDIHTWRRALDAWDEAIRGHLPGQPLRALEIGAGNGGATLWLNRRGADCVCSDVVDPRRKALPLHDRYGISQRIAYAVVDAANAKIPETLGLFDIVVFKSVLGAIERGAGREGLERAIHGMFQALKPGGLLLFAENMRGSRVHQRLRKRFKRWGGTWIYQTPAGLEALLARYGEVHLATFGLLGCFPKVGKALSGLDRVLCRKSMSDNHYMGYGYVVKPIEKEGPWEG